MKISSVTIHGMHRVVNKTYEFNEDGLSYLVGGNGQGKSTVLKAIQLGILGYIPGENKNVSQIFRHCNGNEMSVQVNFSDGSYIKRSWKKSGSSIKSDVDCTTTDLEAQLKDIELPIFNFNELLGMTSNKLKDWFIDFLPSSESEIDWDSELKSALDGLAPMDPKITEEALSIVNEVEYTNAIGWVNSVNQKFKEELKFHKEDLNRLNSTIQTLIFHEDIQSYDDPEAEIQNLNSQIDVLSKEKDKLVRNLEVTRRNSQITSKLESMSPVEISETEIEDLQQLRVEISQLNSEIDTIQNKIQELSTSAAGIRAEIDTRNKMLAGNGICPYTYSSCDSILSLNEKLKKEVEELHDSMSKVNSEITHLNQEKVKKSSEVSIKSQKVNTYNSKITASKNYESQKSNLLSLLQDVEDTNTRYSTVDEYTEEISQIQDTILKIRENCKYNSMIDTLTQQKYVIENTIEVYKKWVKLTDPNGLPTKLSEAPFKELKLNMDNFLKEFFVKEDIECHFNLEQKANSFSLGILRNNTYIPYELLSSGEKTMYAVSLMMCIIQSSNSDLKLLLADDIVDHLDSDNAVKFFEKLSTSNVIQVILAGVIDNTQGKCIEV